MGQELTRRDNMALRQRWWRPGSVFELRLFILSQISPHFTLFITNNKAEDLIQIHLLAVAIIILDIGYVAA